MSKYNEPSGGSGPVPPSLGGVEPNELTTKTVPVSPCLPVGPVGPFNPNGCEFGHISPVTPELLVVTKQPFASSVNLEPLLKFIV